MEDTYTLNSETDLIFSWPPRYINKRCPNSHAPKGFSKMCWHLSPEISLIEEAISPLDEVATWFPPNSGGKRVYRESLEKTYRKCTISGIDVSECEGAHIVPRNICAKFNLKFIFHSANGLLLSRNLHASFDNYIWTFDIYDFQEIPGDMNHVLLSTIIIKNRKNYTIRQYQKDGEKLRYFKVPINSIPYLYIHYNMFLLKNYNFYLETEVQMYQKFLESGFFYSILQNPYMFFSLIKEYHAEINIMPTQKQYRVVLNQKYSLTGENTYLVLWDFMPFSEASWVPEFMLSYKEPIQDFEYLRSIKRDASY